MAEYYDEIFGFHRQSFRAARRSVLGKVLPKVESACDLACGTGTTALELAAEGLRMSAVDLSPVMCRLAREKAAKAGISMKVIRADMRSFRLAVPVDLITCEADAVNHIPRKSALALVTAAVFAALRPGGYFYFDVNNRLLFETIWPATWFLEKPGVAVVMQGGYDRPRDVSWTDIDWFLRDGKCWKRRSERIEQICWTPAEVRSALLGAGFDKLRAYDAAPFFSEDPLMRPGCRTFFLARKAL